MSVPVGQVCIYCTEGFERTDIGFGYAGGAHPIHHECSIRSVVGSVAHQEKRCSCFVPGSTEEDPPGMTRREAAKAARDLYEAQQWAQS